MNPALLIVILVVLVIGTFVVVVLRSSLRMQRESHAFLHELAPRLGASLEREDPARLTGERNGRRFIVTLRRRSSSRYGTTVETWIEIPVATDIHLQVEPQVSDLGARIAGDVVLHDPAFDAACLLRTTAPGVAERALDADMRAAMADGCRTGDLTLLVVKGQWLRLELRGAPDDPENEPMVTRYLDAALALAGRLDAAAAEQA
ncbi:hypothetical protein TBR22_A11110 [Luteitalea sp. TBR-22]|uniref:hypothetical protein n=1 Tax=Luteitalea sp. TBR-22 TaxID=2802971 RepID=UPI001AF8F4EF|nr:hypothetical protein [Luteitalea sp. TBR-22]BCS31908.1 hypothetical protein TBR22_A11110 [Luteitalea sp. TBR-22]